MSFQDLWNKFSFIFGQLCDEKTCAFVVMGIGKKVVQNGGEMGRCKCPFCWCVCVCLWGEGGLGGYNQAKNVALTAKY